MHFSPIATLSATIRMPPPPAAATPPIRDCQCHRCFPRCSSVAYSKSCTTSAQRLEVLRPGTIPPTSLSSGLTHATKSVRHIPCCVANAGVVRGRQVVGNRLPRSGRQTKASVSPYWVAISERFRSLVSSQGVLPRIEAGCPGSGKLATFVSVSPSRRRMSMSLSTKFPT